MGGQCDLDAVVDVEPLRMVVALFRIHCHLCHEAEGLDKIGELEFATDQAAALWFKLPSRKLGYRTLNGG